VVRRTTTSSQPKSATGPVTDSSPRRKDSSTNRPMPAPRVASAITVNGGSRRQRSRCTTDDDHPMRIPWATAQASHTTGTAMTSDRFVTRRVPGSTSSSRSRFGARSVSSARSTTTMAAAK
jgi:hypothetical protein